jgi:conjugative transfer region protein (TIGR03750 family)
MDEQEDIRTDGTVVFLPHRLNRHPVVVRGLTADELWICAALSAIVGLVIGIALAVVFSAFAIVPTAIVLVIAVGVFVGSGVLRRLKRGRPNTWLYRQMQWRIACHHPWLAPFVGAETLVTRSGVWSTRRTRS